MQTLPPGVGEECHVPRNYGVLGMQTQEICYLVLHGMAEMVNWIVRKDSEHRTCWTALHFSNPAERNLTTACLASEALVGELQYRHKKINSCLRFGLFICLTSVHNISVNDILYIALNLPSLIFTLQRSKILKFEFGHWSEGKKGKNKMGVSCIQYTTCIYEMNFTLCVLLVYNDNGSVQTLCITCVR